MAYPSVEEAMTILADITESPEPLRADMMLVDADIDSLDVFEWIFELGISEDVVDSDEIMSAIDSLTLGGLYQQLVEWAQAAEGSAPGEATS